MIEVLRSRIQADPFNLAATAIFLLAILHTFLAPVFARLAHRLAHASADSTLPVGSGHSAVPVGATGNFLAEALHFLGEVEVIFGLWVVPLLVVMTGFKGWGAARDYLGHELNFTEPLFVVVIMVMAASRPILQLAERIMAALARLGRGSPAAWWLAILTAGPVLGSFITEPAAMTISALLLARTFYALRPGPILAYATLGLLFVNVSVGGTLTHFAAPPVLMVAGKWGWGVPEMLGQFGWKAVLGIAVANAVYGWWFRAEFRQLGQVSVKAETGPAPAPVPVWITMAHVLFLIWTVVNAHYPVLFAGGFLFYLGFVQVTARFQDPLAVRSPLLVGFFLAGLVVHGGLQGWWIEPALRSLGNNGLFVGAAVLTAFNDNAAITYLASQVSGLSDALKYAVVAGAMAGGGLTVIANAPNPAGQAILGRFFPGGISAGRLFLGALVPTLIMTAAFLLLR